MKFTLRPYQTGAVDELREVIAKSKKRSLPIICLPTGAGKTVTFSYLAELVMKKFKRVGVCCHRIELIEQAKQTMSAYGLPVDRIAFGMVQTFARSPHKIPDVDVWIIDEVHIGNFRKFIDLLPKHVQVVGATATPISASKKNPLNKTFTDVVSPVQIIDLINEGFLSKPIYNVWKIDDSKLVKDFNGEFTGESQAKVFSVKNLLEAVERRHGKTIIFCSSITQCNLVYDSIGDLDKFVVHSKMKNKERARIIQLYKQTDNAIIINCGILTAGFDEPAIKTVIVFRATTSVALWLQMTGRGSRVLPDKDTFYIYDLGNNMARLMPWEANRDWKSIFELQGKKIKDQEAPMKFCKSCEAIIYASQTICPYCGAQQPTKEKEELLATEIKVISSFHDLPENLQKPYELMSVEELIERAQYGSPQMGRPFKLGWIVSHLKTRSSFKEDINHLAKIKGYKQGWIHRQLK